jgi:hypothetical protein
LRPVTDRHGEDSTAIDGYDLSGLEEIGAERIHVATRQRYDLAFTMPVRGQVRSIDWRAKTGSRAICHQLVDLALVSCRPRPRAIFRPLTSRSAGCQLRIRLQTPSRMKTCSRHNS